jgi:hypothetical protein
LNIFDELEIFPCLVLDLPCLICNDLLAFHAASLPFAFACVPFDCILHLTLAVRLSVLPFACVNTAVSIAALTVPVSLVIFEGALVDVSVRILDKALTMMLVVVEVPLIVDQSLLENVTPFASEGTIAEPPNKDSWGVALGPNSDTFSTHA